MSDLHDSVGREPHSISEWAMPKTIFEFMKIDLSENHRISVKERDVESAFSHGLGREFVAVYEGGSATLSVGHEVASISGSFDTGTEFCPGSAMLGNGRIDIAHLPGIGVGSLLMGRLVEWVRAFRIYVEVVPITLSGDDAASDNLPRRNAFYKKFGFEFPEGENCTHGTAKAMMTHELIIPKIRASQGWTLTIETVWP